VLDLRHVLRLYDDRARHPVGDVHERGRGSAVVHEDSRYGRDKAERLRGSGRDVGEVDVGATCAAWKSTECAIAAPFLSLTATHFPCRTWITGPGAVFPNAHAS
jgi:hypothetical protein